MKPAKLIENVIDGQLTAVDNNPLSCYIWHAKGEFRHPFHQHKKAQLTYFEGGAAFFHTKDKSYFLPARHYLWVPPGLLHYFEQRAATTVIRNIYLPLSAQDDHPFYHVSGIYPASNLVLEMLLYTEKWKNDLLPNTVEFQFLMTLKNILPEISKHPLPIALPTTDNERLRPILRYLHENVGENLNIKNVALKFGFSERSFFRLFRTDLNISFLQYVKLLRVIKGMEMLLKADKNISQIAFETGYESISAFSNTFYQVLGVRPSSIRS